MDNDTQPPGEASSQKTDTPSNVEHTDSTPQPVVSPKPADTYEPAADGSVSPQMVTPQPVVSPMTNTDSPQPPVGVVSAGDVDEQNLPATAPTSLQSPELEWETTGDDHGSRGSLWFGSMVLGSICLSALIFLFTRDIVSTGVVLVALIGVVVYSGRQPKTGHYAFRADYLYVNNKPYNLKMFKSFSMTEESATVVFRLEALKRLMPYIVLYAPANLADQITTYLTAYLPQQEHKPELTEELFRRLKM